MPQGKKPRISVVVPLYNEEGNVLPLIEELMPILIPIDPHTEIIMINDGSLDATTAKMAAAQELWPENIRGLTFAKNTGQTAAIDAGFREARGDIVVMMDGDLQVDPRDLPEMIRLTDQYDVVHGWRWQRLDTPFKRFQTRIANGIRNWLTKSDVHDTGCPVKVFRREVVAQFKLYTGLHRFFITLAQMEGFSTHEFKVRHRDRFAGVSKYGMLNRVFRALRDLFAVRWMMSRNYHLAYTEIAAKGHEQRSKALPEQNLEESSGDR